MPPANSKRAASAQRVLLVLGYLGQARSSSASKRFRGLVITSLCFGGIICPGHRNTLMGTRALRLLRLVFCEWVRQWEVDLLAQLI
jgi:hypothetical protein